MGKTIIGGKGPSFFDWLYPVTETFDMETNPIVSDLPGWKNDQRGGHLSLVDKETGLSPGPGQQIYQVITKTVITKHLRWGVTETFVVDGLTGDGTLTTTFSWWRAYWNVGLGRLRRLLSNSHQLVRHSAR